MKIVEILEKILADSYSLYSKTQNYHWNVQGPEFKTLHLLFEEQYQDLAEAIDEIAERIRMLGSKVSPLAVFIKLSSLTSPTPDFTSLQILKDLAADQKIIISNLYEALKITQNMGDEGTSDMIIGRIKIHEKNKWMLESSVV